MLTFIRNYDLAKGFAGVATKSCKIEDFAKKSIGSSYRLLGYIYLDQIEGEKYV